MAERGLQAFRIAGNQIAITKHMLIAWPISKKKKKRNGSEKRVGVKGDPPQMKGGLEKKEEAHIEEIEPTREIRSAEKQEL